MLFASLGKTPTNSGWNYVLTLYSFMAAISLSAYFATLLKQPKNLWQLICSLFSGALLGFYYGGVATDNNPQIATVSAIVLSVVFALGYWQQSDLFSLLITIIASIAAYGLAFFLGTQALSLLSVTAILSGSLWGVFCVVYLILALNLAISAIAQIISANVQN